jgi:hypothetical protein
VTPRALVVALLPHQERAGQLWDAAIGQAEDDYRSNLLWLHANDAGDLWKAAIGAAARRDLTTARAALTEAGRLAAEFGAPGPDAEALALIDQAEREAAGGNASPDVDPLGLGLGLGF